MNFDYKKAFSRNLGWVTEAEQETLKNKTVAIAGLGGVGGAHLLTLTRLGIGNFNLADYDHFEVENFNRQAGAMISTLEQPKLETMANMALDINPHLIINHFKKGVSEGNLHSFFKDTDVYVDSLDFFCFQIRQQVFQYLYENKIPAVTAAPLGLSAANLNFLPGHMSFEDYFGLDTVDTDFDKGLLFLLGLSPSMPHSKYLVAEEYVDFKNKRGPSTGIACQLCSGTIGAEVLKLLLKRGRVLAAPHSIQIDAYLNKSVARWVPFGYKNPIQRLKFFIAKRKYSSLL